MFPSHLVSNWVEHHGRNGKCLWCKIPLGFDGVIYKKKNEDMFLTMKPPTFEECPSKPK